MTECMTRCFTNEPDLFDNENPNVKTCHLQ